MKETLFAAAVLLAGFFFFFVQPAGMDSLFCPGRAYAQDDWKKEFEDLCGVTQDVMAFSRGELKGLIERCDRLKPAIEKLEDTQSRFYLKRLQMCRSLFVYALEVKENQ